MALTLGTNSGFVSSAPSTDPAGSAVSAGSGTTVIFVTKHITPSGSSPTVTEMGWYRSDNIGGASSFGAAIYADSAGVPGALVSSTAINAGSNTDSEGWKKITGLSIALSASTSYWIAIFLPSDASDGFSIDRASSDGSGIDYKLGSSGFDDPFSGGTLYDADGMWAFYALYTTSATPPSINIGDTWKEIDWANSSINIGDTWKAIAGVAVNIGDTWKTVYGTP